VKQPLYRNPRYQEALEEQVRLGRQRRESPLPSPLRWIGGADVSFHLYGTTFWGGMVVCDAQAGFRVVERAVVRMEVDFPYIPGLLGFREVPVLARAFEALSLKPEAILVDAHGTAHPRRFGSAAHLGVVLGVPTVGSAKSLLCGSYDEPPPQRGGWSPILLDGTVIGAALRTRSYVRPVYVSPGHLSDLPTAVALVLACSPLYRLPEPIRKAHGAVNEARRSGQTAP